MIVRCINNSIDAIANVEIRNHVCKDVHLSQIGLQIGKSYHVFGISFSDSIPRYLVCDEESANYPTPFHAIFFELVDGTLDKDWWFTHDCTNLGGYALLPQQWANDPGFLEKLVDGEAEARSVFEKLKKDVLE